MSQDPNVRDTATSMAVDSAGQVYVTGRTENTNTLHRFNEYLTAKFGSDGGLRWAARYRGATNGDNYAEVLRLDSDGNCYVTGSSVTNDVQSTREIATVKYDPEGHQLWVSRVGTRPENFPQALALDQLGNAYATGHAGGNNLGSWLTIKINSVGEVQWAQEYIGPTYQAAGYAVVPDKAGNVFVTGTVPSSNFIGDMMTLKYGPDGTLLWSRSYDTPGEPLSSETGYVLAMDAADNLCVAGGGNPGFITLKYNNGGTQLWQSVLPSQFSSWDAQFIAVDGASNLIIGGFAPVRSDAMEWGLAKYSPGGSNQWSRLVHFVPGYYDDLIAGLAVDADGGIYVTGTAVTNSLGNSCIVTEKFAPDGTPVWRMAYRDPAMPKATACGLGLDAAGNVFVAGTVTTPTTNAEYIVIKYEQAGLAARLRFVGFDSTGAAQLSLFARSNAVYTVEASENLRDWRSFANVSNSTGTAEVKDPDMATFAQKFYRAHQP